MVKEEEDVEEPLFINSKVIKEYVKAACGEGTLTHVQPQNHIKSLVDLSVVRNQPTFIISNIYSNIQVTYNNGFICSEHQVRQEVEKETDDFPAARHVAKTVVMCHEIMSWKQSPGSENCQYWSRRHQC